MAPRILPVWSPPVGDINLTAALLNEILGGSSGAYGSTTISTVGAGVLTAAALVGGQIARVGPTAAYTDTTDTAAAIVSALGGFQLGQAFQVLIKNATAYVQTLAGGAGVTMPTTVIVPPFSGGRYYAAVGGTSASPTVTFGHANTTPINVAAEVAAPQALPLVTVGAGTILAAGVNAGVTTRGGTQIAAFTDTTDTAALLVAGVSAFATVDLASTVWTYVNNTIFPATLAGGTGVTFSGVTVVPANSWAKYLVTRTSATAVTMVCIGQGYFPKSGTAIANGATPVAVVDAAVTAGSTIALTLKTVGGTPHGAFVSSVTPGTGFSINSLASDTSTYNYEIRG